MLLRTLFNATFSGSILGILLFVCFPMQAQPVFNKGVNLTGWFQASSTNAIQYTKYTKKDFQNIKSMGCDVVRLPINLFHMTTGSPNYNIDPLLYDFLDNVADWAEQLNMYLIIDNHTSDDWGSQNSDLESVLCNVWTQMATHYKNRSTYILYEIMNEPNGPISTAVWGNIQQKAINAIRKCDSKHCIVVGAAAYNSYTELSSLPVYTDTNLLYTFHFYDPFVFTHQGASWVTPSMTSLANVPFPYNSSAMPSTPADLSGTWVASSLYNYTSDGTLAKVKSLIDIAASFKTNRNVSVYCGEFGVYMPNSPTADRNYWYSEVRKYLESKGIPWTTWDYQGGFGLFTKGSSELFEYNLNTALVAALGLNVPAQKTYTCKPDSTGFSIYSDYIGEQIIESNNTSGATINYYSTDQVNNGKYCLFWNGSAQYGTLGFNFVPDKDLSKLKQQNYALSLLVRATKSATKVDLRFIDTKSSTSDHPWRMNYTLDDKSITPDGLWHRVYIPLSDFVEGGAWDNAWYNPSGLFDWKAVDRFDIVAEQAALTGKSIWFDNIQIVNMDTAHVYNTNIFTPLKNISATGTQASICPTIIRSATTIHYVLSENKDVSIRFYKLSGSKIDEMTFANQAPGEYSIQWKKPASTPGGIYICRITLANETTSIKLILL